MEFIQEDIQRLREVVLEKDKEIDRLLREIHKLKVKSPPFL
jgi:hypothetical protein